MNNPAITVLMSAYNGEKYLREAIESILHQTFKGFEFIIINDGSTDSTKEIIEEYAARDERIKLINNIANLGLTKSLNIGLKEARGEYIARLDADDVALPERLQKQFDFLESNRDIALAGAWAEIIDEQGKTKGFIKGETDERTLAFKMIFNNQLTHSSIFFKRDIALAVGGYNKEFQYAQDYELYSRLMTKHRIANHGEILVKFRAHNQAITKKQNIKEFYKQTVLGIIKGNIARWVDIDDKIFDELAQAIIIKNSPIRLTWGRYRRCRTLFEKIITAFLADKKIPEVSRLKIEEHRRNISRALIKKLIKGYISAGIRK